MQQQGNGNVALHKLIDTDLDLKRAGDDIRGCKVIDRHGTDIGHVSALFVERAQRTVRMVEVRAGGFLGIGVRYFLLPVEAITQIARDEVHVNQTRERVNASPAYDPALVEAPQFRSWDAIYSHYGFSPFMGIGPFDSSIYIPPDEPPQDEP